MDRPSKRMLFVDDESVILQGLERMLFEMTDDWDMVFVDTPERALAALNESPFDVVISDVRMPGMDGATLLSRVQQEHPEVVRILLTGYSELEATLRAMPVAHRFLTKPCKPALLVDVLSKSCALSTLLQQKDLRTLVGGVSGLPTRPEVYARLRDVIADAEVEPADIASIVSRDVALSSKVLHLTNSAFLGARQNFVNVAQAVSYIGVRMFRELMLSTQVFTALSPENASADFSLEASQDHALAVAGIARAIAGNAARTDAAFLAGMMHDIGKLVWATHAPKLAQQLEGQRVAGHSLLPTIEENTSGTMHGRVGAYLLGLWGVEEPVVEAVAYHHDPAVLKATSLDLATIVHAADALAHQLENERHGIDAPSMLDLAHLERLGALDQLERWQTSARELWAEEER